MSSFKRTKGFLYFIACFSFVQSTGQGKFPRMYHPLPSPSETLLVLDAENRHRLPPKLRSTRDSYKPFKILELYKHGEELPTREGLDSLNASSSAQFSETGFQLMLEKLPLQGKQLYVVDLREESHGFSDGNALSWYGKRNSANAGHAPLWIEEHETELLEYLSKPKKIHLYKIHAKTKGNIRTKIPLSFQPKRILTEKELIEGKSFNYKRFFVTDHDVPTDQQVDEFITFVQHLPKNAWLHFHCRGGAGRSSTFLVMYDMLRNAKNVSFKEIINRQILLGSISLVNIPKTASHIEENLAKKRRNFIKKFYRYARDEKGFQTLSWSTWNKEDRRPLRYPLSQMYLAP